MARIIPVLLAAVTVFTLTLTALGQGPINTTGTSNCSAADFEVGVQFHNDPGDYYTIIIDKRNISTHRCVFDGTVYGPSFVIDQKEGQKPPLLDYFPETRLPNGFQPLATPLTLESGQVARQKFRWRTRPSNESVPCVQPKWMSHPILLNVPSILKRICSAVEVSRFSLAPSSQETWNALGDVDHSLTLHLTSDRDKYYLGEDFLVRLSQISHPPKRI
jgi:hypothetical protein